MNDKRGRFFIFKQKTAYEMRISDWSSDVCSSDLAKRRDIHRRFRHIVAVDFLTHGPHILNHRILMGCAVLTGLVVKGVGDHVWDSTAFAMAARALRSSPIVMSIGRQTS